MALLALAADPAVTAGSNAPVSGAAFAEHVAALRKTVPDGFTVVPQSPFVVIGDEPPDKVRQRATNTVRWAVEKLKAEYFARDPAGTVDIWLFRDHESYMGNVRRLFHTTPTTRFGYYSETHRALFMDIATGGGTLVHEIVHPFVRANFQDCPAWFNEGLASLYEQSAERDGHIKGLVNWRLKGLERKIKEGTLPSLRELTSTSDTEFYGGSGNANYSENYGQARYLCYYLQEKKLLGIYYREFVANAGKDPTGYETLKRVLGEKDMGKFQKKWEKFVLELRNGGGP